MELNCEISNPSSYTFGKFYCQKDNYENNVCSSEMIEEKSCTVLGVNNCNKPLNLLSTIMEDNIHHLEMFKSKHFPHSYNCRAENAIKIFFGWSVGVNIKELCEYLDISEDVAKHFYLLSTLYAKKYIKNHIDEWKVGGFGVVILLDIYPQGCKKFNYLTNSQQNILCLAEIKDIPTKYWFQILTQTETDKKNDEILQTIQGIVRSGSILVIDLESTTISEATYQKMKSTYRVVTNLKSLKQHDTEDQCLLNNLETIWKPALDICEFGNYHSDVSSYYTSFLWNQRFGNDNLSILLNQF